MASEITEEEVENTNPSYSHNKDVEKMRIRQIIEYQKSLNFSSSLSSSSCSSFSSAAASTSSFSSPRKSSSLLDLMREGSTSLGRLFDMEHTSLGDYFKDYSVSPIIKPILLWGSDTDDDSRVDPWAGMRQSGGQGIVNDGVFVQHRKTDRMRKARLTRTKSYRRLPKFSLWRCGGLRIRLRLIKVRIMVRGRKL